MPLEKLLVVLPILPFFLRVADRLSFTKAAEDLHVTQAAVSHRIKQLEEELEVPLFHRYSRKIALTNEGHRLYGIVSGRLSELEQEIGRFDHNEVSGALTVHCSPSFLHAWLVPRLGSLRAEQPDISVHLSCRNDVVDLETEGVDIAINYGVRPYAGVRDILLMDEWLFPVCTPKYAKQHRLRARGLRALADCTLLHDNSPWPNSCYNSEWLYWANQSKTGYLNTNAGYSYDSCELALIAARHDVGIALGRKQLVRDLLASGELVAPFKSKEVQSPQSYYLLYRKEDSGHARIAAFIQWILTETAGTL